MSRVSVRALWQQRFILSFVILALFAQFACSSDGGGGSVASDPATPDSELASALDGHPDDATIARARVLTTGLAAWELSYLESFDWSIATDDSLFHDPVMRKAVVLLSPVGTKTMSLHARSLHPLDDPPSDACGATRNAAKQALLQILARFAANPRVVKTCVAAVGTAEIPGVNIALSVACVAAATWIAGDEIGRLVGVTVQLAFDSFEHCAGAAECVADKAAATSACAGARGKFDGCASCSADGPPAPTCPSGPAPADCNDVVAPPLSTPVRCEASAAPTMTGGTIRDGFYVCSEYAYYTAGAGCSSDTVATGILVCGNQFFVSHRDDSVSRQNVTFVTSGVDITTTRACETTNSEGPFRKKSITMHYTATDNDLTFTDDGDPPNDLRQGYFRCLRQGP